MIPPVRNSTSPVPRVMTSRVVAGARNVAEVSDTPTIEVAAATKRTGAQEESLINESLDKVGPPAKADSVSQTVAEPDPKPKTLDDNIAESQAWNQRLRDATEAYRNTIENLDKDFPKVRPGDIYNTPF